MRHFLGALGLAAVIAGCPAGDGGAGGGAQGAQVCTPGEAHACTCTDGRHGAQDCVADGEGLGACVCTGIGGGGSGGQGSSASSSGSTGGAASSSRASSSTASSSASSSVASSSSSSGGGSECAGQPTGTACTENAGHLCQAGACVKFIPVHCKVGTMDYVGCDGFTHPGGIAWSGPPAGGCLGQPTDVGYCPPGTECAAGSPAATGICQ